MTGDHEPPGPAERELLTLSGSGKSTTEIGVAAGMSEDDVSRAISRLLERFVAHQRREAGIEFGHVETLSDRQQQVLIQLAFGKTNREIALALGISFGRVKDLVSEILRKTGASGRTQAAVAFVAWLERRSA
jgi:DNA-binding NarL/FixJ family response regulator